MNIKRGRIVLENLQIKSLDKAKKLAQALSVIEEECGIHEVDMVIKGLFICPWIKLSKLDETEMEKLLAGLIFEVQNK